VHDPFHKAEIYKCLWLPMMEPDQGTFQTILEGFFYNLAEMCTTVYYIFSGELCETCWLVIHDDLYLCYFSIYTEKWALTFRYYDHKDTDTNMFVESII